MKMDDHFSRLASLYNLVRKTDIAPIRLLGEWLNSVERIEAVDVGCGSGRYVPLLFERFGDRLKLVGVDKNQKMLAYANDLVIGMGEFSTKVGEAESLPVQDRELDSVFTFNAIHHFDLRLFLDEVVRVLKKDAFLFIYTRFRNQNESSVWGECFPCFCERETRLYVEGDLKSKIEESGKLKIEKIEEFRFSRSETLDRLLFLARNRHYSTFDLFSQEEFELALRWFEITVKKKWMDVKKVSWLDRNSMVVVRKTE